MECDCGDPIRPTAGNREIFWCATCGKLWRLSYKDPVNGNTVLIDYEAELEEQRSNAGPLK